MSPLNFRQHIFLTSPYTAVCNGECRVSDCCVKPVPVPRPPHPAHSQTCASFKCPYGWQKVVDAGLGMQ
jgi:hypothetical protein